MGENQLGQAKYNRSSIQPEVSMRAILSFVLVLGMSAGVFAQQTLGDIARQNRTKKKGTSNVKLDDDNMPRTATPPSRIRHKDKKDDDNASAADKSKDEKDATKKENADAQSKKGDEIKGKLEEQKRRLHACNASWISPSGKPSCGPLLITVMQAPNCATQAKFAEEMRKQQEEMDSKKQAIDAAQQKLTDLQEEARKSGVKSE